ncbi:MAG: hypothetical protein OQK12_09950 [Motiliproteus sp.]|nr:hypothetical protein [Motiliproteus sp.]MCW9051308.1 hypothetical protein [Motiliproteus sp.]
MKKAFDKMSTSPEIVNRTENQQDSVSVDIPLALLERLLADGQICVAQLRSLDRRSHQALKSLCLQCCAKRVRGEGLVAMSDDLNEGIDESQEQGASPLKLVQSA